MKIKKELRVFFYIIPLILGPLLFSNCIALNFGDLDTETIGIIPDSSIKKQKVFLTLSAKWIFSGKEKPLAKEFIDEKMKLTAEAYENSGLFVVEKENNGNLQRIHVDILEVSNINQGFVMLSGITFGLLPAWGTADIFMKTTYIDSQGKSTAEVIAKGSQFFASQIVLIILMPIPYFFSFYKYDNFIREMNRYSINEAIRIGILQIR